MVMAIQGVKGMNDILPPDTFTWQYAEKVFQRVLQNHGYREIRFPVVEKTELFKRSIGEVTDIVEKEMYTFLDRNEDSLSLRPEGTACCVRAAQEHGLLHNQIQRLWYAGPYFRYERPQKGRYRQFHQCAAEVFGLEGPEVDAEIIMMSATILDKLGIRDFTQLEINSLGTVQSRKEYRKLLVTYFTKHKSELDEDSLRRLDKNPLRILDSKNPALVKVIAGAPKLIDHLDEESKAHFDKLKFYLDAANIPYKVNTRLVRGLDYYTKTVFEWTTDRLGSQGAICAGGRYDGLVEQLGGKPTPSLGFAFGMERTLLLMQQSDIMDKVDNHLHVYMMMEKDEHFPQALNLASYLRNKVPRLRLILHCGGGSLKNQFKKADKSGAIYAIIIGDHEIKSQSVSLKHLREDIQQQTLYQDELAEFLKLKLFRKL